jgi:hypothetical protein
MEQVRINAFFRCLNEMLDDMISVYPGEYSLKMVQTGIMALQSSYDNKEMIKNFYEFVEPNYTHIKNKNEAFFISDDIAKTIPSNYIILFQQLKGLLEKESTTQQTKDALFNYIEQLYKISKIILH